MQVCACLFAVFLCQTHLTSSIRSTFTPAVSGIQSTSHWRIFTISTVNVSFFVSLLRLDKHRAGRNTHMAVHRRNHSKHTVSFWGHFISFSIFIYAFSLVSSEPVYIQYWPLFQPHQAECVREQREGERQTKEKDSKDQQNGLKRWHKQKHQKAWKVVNSLV